jgi:hypothetical protein
MRTVARITWTPKEYVVVEAKPEDSAVCVDAQAEPRRRVSALTISAPFLYNSARR